MTQLFISYSRKDTEFAQKLTESLTAQKMDLWVDWEDIPPTVDWMKEIEKGIEAADIFVFIVSPDSIRSKVCAEEVAHAVKNGKRIAPVVAREVDMAEIPNTLSHLNLIFFSHPQDKFETAFEKLMHAIQTDFDWVRTHARLQVRALEWGNNKKESSFLLRGNDLKDAEAQVLVNAEKSPTPTDLQHDYISTSRGDENIRIETERAKEQQLLLEQKLGTRLRRLTYLLLVVFTIAYGALFFWLNTITNTLAINSIKDQMLALVETSVCFINVNIDGYQSFLDSYSVGDNKVYESDWYSFMSNLLGDIKATNKNIRTNIELYTITQGKDSGEFLIVASTDNAIDYKTAFTSNGSSSAQIAGMNKTTVDVTVYQGWISACSPIINSNGDSIGAMCADFNAQLLEETRQKVTTTLGIAFIAIYPAMIALVFFTTRSFQKKRVDISRK